MGPRPACTFVCCVSCGPSGSSTAHPFAPALARARYIPPARAAQPPPHRQQAFAECPLQFSSLPSIGADSATRKDGRACHPARQDDRRSARRVAMCRALSAAVIPPVRRHVDRQRLGREACRGDLGDVDRAVIQAVELPGEAAAFVREGDDAVVVDVHRGTGSQGHLACVGCCHRRRAVEGFAVPEGVGVGREGCRSEGGEQGGAKGRSRSHGNLQIVRMTGSAWAVPLAHQLRHENNSRRRSGSIDEQRHDESAMKLEPLTRRAAAARGLACKGTSYGQI
mmetsp:Transcript_53123/g.124236  ORF Transcript_53123/g.124236 Transcript_53123/m.124236 type:complete len:281 (+) Transcript_53123:3235-4077(+)